MRDAVGLALVLVAVLSPFGGRALLDLAERVAPGMVDPWERERIDRARYRAGR